MKITRLDSNECGGFRPPKSHLDTQMYPECEGTPCDRDIVKKTVEKRKNKKKKASVNKEAKLGLFLKSHNSPWGKWKDSSKEHADNVAFVNGIYQLWGHGGEAFLPMTADYHLIRRMIAKALQKAFREKSEEAFLGAANSISAALSYAEPIAGGEVKSASCNSRVTKAKHSWPISTHDEKGIWQQWLKEQIDDRQFVSEMLQLSKTSGFPGLSNNPAVRDSIQKILATFEHMGDYSSTALQLNTWLKADQEMTDNPEEVRLIANKNKKGHK